MNTTNKIYRAFPGGAVVKTLPSSAAGTCSIPLVPWSAGGAYMSSTLGVATFDYVPWAIFNYTGFLFAILWGFTGFGIKKIEPKKDETKA